MSRRQSMTFDSTLAAASSMRWLRVIAKRSVASIATLSLRDLHAQRFRLRDQLREPLREIRFLAILRLPLHARGHGDELVDEGAEVVGVAEEQQRRRLVLDRRQRLQRLRVLGAEVGEIGA